jgi:hypothetical protein
MGGAVTASWTYPQQRQVPYAPYQSFSMIMEPRQRGQVRGSDVFMQDVPFQSCSAAPARRRRRYHCRVGRLGASRRLRG